MARTFINWEIIASHGNSTAVLTTFYDFYNRDAEGSIKAVMGKFEEELEATAEKAATSKERIGIRINCVVPIAEREEPPAPETLSPAEVQDDMLGHI